MGIDLDPGQREAIAAEVNLSVLRRTDPAVRAILVSATHVALYQLSDNNSWRRCDVEGSLFVVERNPRKDPSPPAAPFRLVIVNRKSLDNYSDDLVVGNKDVEHTDQMIMYSNSSGATMGIWFLDRDEALSTFSVLQKILNGERPHSGPAPRPKRSQKRLYPQKSPPSQKSPQKSPQKSAQKSLLQKSSAYRNNPPQKGPPANPALQNAPPTQSPSAARNYPSVSKGPPPNALFRSNPVQEQMCPPPASTTTSLRTQPLATDSLQRFFPHLNLADGVAGEAVPDNAQQSSVVEAESATTFKPPMDVDGAIVHSAEIGSPDTVLAQLMHGQKPRETGSPEEVLDELMVAASTAEKVSLGLPSSLADRSEPPVPTRQSNVASVREKGKPKSPAKSKVSVKPMKTSTAENSKQSEEVVVRHAKETVTPVPKAGVQVVEANTPVAVPASVSTSTAPSLPTNIAMPSPARESDVANFRMQAMIAQNLQLQEARLRELASQQAYRLGMPRDVPVGGSNAIGGNRIGAGVVPMPAGPTLGPLPSGSGMGASGMPPVSGMMPVPPTSGMMPAPAVSGMVGQPGAGMGAGHFGGVHPQMAMLMHQHQYQLYLQQQQQQQQYLANVHQQQMHSQVVPQALQRQAPPHPASQHQGPQRQGSQRQASQQQVSQHQRQLEQQQQQMYRQTQEQHRQTQSEVEVVGGGKDVSLRRMGTDADELAAVSSDLKRMLNVGQSIVPETIAKMDDRNVGNDDMGSSIGQGMVAAERAGQMGSFDGGKLDRTSFRAVVQRMLTDRKLFDCVYDHYMGWNE